MHRLLHAVVAVLLFVPLASSAMDIVVESNWVRMRGEITRGDTQKLLRAIRDVQHDYAIPGMVLLSSPGGDVNEAVMMAEIINRLQWSVAIEQRRVCASACFFLFLAGEHRSAEGMPATSSSRPALAGRLGLHRPYVRGVTDANEYQRKQRILMQKVSIYLERKRVPRRLIDIMMSRSSEDIYWPTRTDLREIGLVPAEIEELYLARCKNLGARTVDFGGGQKIELDALMSSAMCGIGIRRELSDEWVNKIRSGWHPANPLDAIRVDD